MRLVTLLCAIAVLTGCASRPVTPPSPATPAAATLVATSSKVSAPPGYKAVERNGTWLYCTRVASLGTKFKQEVCMTQEQYAEVQRRGENARQELRKSTRICAGGSGISSCNGS
jgi:hypothetical protein